MKYQRLTSRVLLACLALSVAACGTGTTPNDGGDTDSGMTAGMFACGTSMCSNTTQYCQHLTTADASGGTMSTYTCTALPAGCTGADFCMTCLAGMTGLQGCSSTSIGGTSYTVELRR